MQIGFLISLLIMINSYCFGQELPKIIPPSPTSSAIQKFGDYPVGHFTGVPEISIPLFSIQQGDITVPISISYHASGIKLTDKNGFLGTGWVLNAGGRISRTVIGPADEEVLMPTYIKTAEEIPGYLVYPSETYAFLRDIQLGHANAEFDIFSYNFGSHSGKFVLKNDGSFTPVLFPYEPLQITKEILTARINYFEVLDETGTKYRFGKSLSGNDMAIESGPGGRSGWMVTDIVSANDPTNKVSFTYASRAEHRGNRFDTYTWDDDYPIGGNINYEQNWCLTPYNNGYNYSYGYESYDYSTWVTSEINFKTGKIKFILNGDRIEKMEIWDANNNLVRYVKFIFGDESVSRKVLSAVQFYDKTNKFINQYSFNYYGGLPQEDGIGGNARDFWGYYNGATNNASLLPQWSVPGWWDGQLIYYDVGNANREPVENLMQAHSLYKITYPTGGSTEFEFESNRYLKAQNGAPALAGGLRVKKIINYDVNGVQTEVKTYKYGENESGYGKIDIEPTVDAFHYTLSGHGDDGHIPGDFRRRIFQSEPIIDISPHGSPVVYPEVTEYFGDENNNTGKIVYKYEYATRPWLIQDYAKYYVPFYKDWNDGQLTDKFIYKNKGGPGAPVYEMTQKVSNEYEENLRENVRGLFSYRYKILQSCGGVDPVMEEAMDAYYNGQVFKYVDYNVISGEKKLKYITQIDYTPSGNSSTFTQFEYGNLVHIQPTKKITTNSKGETISVEMKYPHDFVAQQPYSDMVNTKHIWSPVIEQSTFKNNTQFLQSLKTNYNYWNGASWSNSGTTMILPQTIEAKRLNNPSEVKVRYDVYDQNANVASIAKENDITYTYLWGYSKTYPVAEVIGKSYNEVVTQSGIDLSILDNPTNDVSLRLELNKLRSLSGCLVTTYTYKPLIGMTSQTDPNGRTTYYEYDGFGRLSFVRDQDGNILKKYCYNYYNQVEDCGVDTNPIWQATGKTRCEPCDQAPAYSTDVLQNEEKDVNPNSPTYTLPRWVDVGTCEPQAVWQNEGAPYCETDGNGNNTGNQVQLQRNQNLCHPQQTRTVVTPSNNCRQMVPLYFFNNYSSDEPVFYISLTNISTNEQFFFENTGGIYLGDVPAGNYNISIDNRRYSYWYTYQVGCGNYMTNDIIAEFYGIPISGDCNEISVLDRY